MAKKQKAKAIKKRAKTYEKPFIITASFDEVIDIALGKAPAPKPRPSKKL